MDVVFVSDFVDRFVGFVVDFVVGLLLWASAYVFVAKGRTTEDIEVTAVVVDGFAAHSASVMVASK